MGDVVPRSKKLEPTDHQRETETLIRWDRSGEPAWLETFDPSVAGGWQRAGIAVAIQGRRYTARVPVGELRVGLKRKSYLSDEQKRATAERLKAARERRA